MPRRNFTKEAIYAALKKHGKLAARPLHKELMRDGYHVAENVITVTLTNLAKRGEIARERVPCGECGRCVFVYRIPVGRGNLCP